MIWKLEGRKRGWQWYFERACLYSPQRTSFSLIRHVHHNSLWISECPQRMNATFTSLSTFLHTAERRIHHHQADTIDTDHATLKLARNAKCLVDVLSEHAGHEAKVCVVGERNDLLFRLEGLNDADWAEDLFTVDFRRRIDVHEDSWLDEVALNIYHGQRGGSHT